MNCSMFGIDLYAMIQNATLSLCETGSQSSKSDIPLLENNCPNDAIDLNPWLCEVTDTDATILLFD